MKTTTYLTGLLATILTFAGALFKINHLPGAGVLIMLGIFILVLIFLPAALINNFKSGEGKRNPVLYLVVWITCAVCFSAMLFKIMHWPGAGYIMLAALPFPYVVFLPVFIVLTSKSKNFSIYNTVFVLLLLTVISAFSALLALNVSKERIADSLFLSHNYYKISNTLDPVPSEASASPENQGIARIIGNLNAYRGKILEFYGITKSQWEADPGVVLLSQPGESRREALSSDSNIKAQANIESGFSELMILLEKDPLCKNLAASAPEIFGLQKLSDNKYILKDEVFVTSQQPWPLINIDGLETSLKILNKLLTPAYTPVP